MNQAAKSMASSHQFQLQSNPAPPPPTYPASIISSGETQKQTGPSVPKEQDPSTDPFVTTRSSQSLSLDNGKEGHMLPVPQFTRHLSPSMDYFSQDVDTAHTSIYLLISFFTSGLIDSVVFNSWSCFVGMQTGRDCGQRRPADCTNYHLRDRKHLICRTRPLWSTAHCPSERLFEIPDVHCRILPWQPLLQCLSPPSLLV